MIPAKLAVRADERIRGNEEVRPSGKKGMTVFEMTNLITDGTVL